MSSEDDDRVLRELLPEAETERPIRRTSGKRADRSERAELDRTRAKYWKRDRACWKHTAEIAEYAENLLAEGPRPNLTPENFGAMVTSAPLDSTAEETPVGWDWF